MTEPWASVVDVAVLRDAKHSVYRWIDAKGVPAHKIGKLWKFRLSEVDAWVRGGDALDHAEPAKGAGTPSRKPTGGL